MAGGGTSTFAYGPDGARAKKISPLGTTNYYGAEAERVSAVLLQADDLCRWHKARLANAGSLPKAAGTPLAAFTPAFRI
jgi:hypothetical protein